MSETGDYLRGIFNGEIPVKRKNPQTGETENVYYQYDDDREELIETASVEKDTTTKAYSKYLKDMKETQAFPFLHRNKFFRYMNCLPIKDVGMSALNAYKTLENNKREMDKLGLIDSDNYFHRKGMCEVAQNGMGDAIIGFSGGIVKEAADFIKKRQEVIPFWIQ